MSKYLNVYNHKIIYLINIYYDDFFKLFKFGVFRRSVIVI